MKPSRCLALCLLTVPQTVLAQAALDGYPSD